MTKRILSVSALIAGLCTPFFSLSAQNITGQDSTVNPITTAVPFAAFTPDARSAAMGDVGAALSPDANSVYWGAAKLASATKDYGVAMSYTPWLRNITDDMYFAYLSGYKKIGKNQAFGASLMYFDHGMFQSRNNQGASTGDFYSNEFYLSLAYSRKLTDNFSMGINVKYLNSNLGGNYSLPGGQSIKAASTVAGDISAYYNKSNVDEATGKGWTYAGALLLQNIGGKVNYGGAQNSFIPTTFKLGGAATRHLDLHNKITFALDVNKLLVPTPTRNVNGLTTSNSDVSSISSIFSSWGDAPGGTSEELKEFMIAAGAEYWYNDAFAVRLGYFSEARIKGDRKYFTIGFGARVQQRYGIDFAYLMPQKQGSPLANTFRISLVIDMFKKQVEDEPTEETEATN
jgi:Type IX secretion system protein PorV